MDTNNPTPKVNPSENPAQPQPISHPVHNQRGNVPIIIAGIILLLVVGSGAYYWGMQNTKYRQVNNSEASISKNNQPIGNPTIVNDTANWKTYTNAKYGYTIMYPEDWYVLSPGNDGVKSVNIQNYEESQVSEQEKKNMSLEADKMSIIIGVYDEPISSNQSLLEWLKSNDKYESAMVGVPESVENITFGDKSAIKLNYQSGPFYAFSNQKTVFYAYFTPDNSNQSTTFNKIISTISFDN